MPSPETPRMRCPECHAPLPPLATSALPEQIECACGRSYPNVGYLEMMASSDGEQAQLDYVPREGREERVAAEVGGYGERRLRRRYWDGFVERLAAMAPPGEGRALLDVGMALVRGRQLKAPHRDLPEHFPVYAAVDPSSVQMRHLAAGDALEGLYILGVGENLPFDDAQFDAVVILHVLDHCFDAQKTLEEAYRVLKPGGVCAIALNNDGSWFKALFARRARQARQAATVEHNWFLTPAILDGMLREAGFAIIDRLEWAYIPVTRSFRNPLLGIPWQAFVAAAEAVGRFLLRGRGGKFVTYARKPGRAAPAPRPMAGHPGEGCHYPPA